MRPRSITNFVEDPTTNTIKMKSPTLFTCGCGSITARLATILPYTGISHAQLNQIKPAHHRLAKQWLVQEGWYKKLPVLNTSTYGILINTKGDFCDINAGATVKCAEKFKEVYYEQ